MNSNEIRCRRYLCSVSPGAWPALLATLLLAGCASSDRSGLPPQQSSTSDLAGAKDVDPSMRERISHALGQDADEGTLRDALKEQPTTIDAAIALARALLRRKCPNEALQVLDGVLLAAPSDLRTLNAKAVVLDYEGRHREAQELYGQALAAEPANPMLRNNLKLSLALEGKTETGNANPVPKAHGRNALARPR